MFFELYEGPYYYFIAVDKIIFLVTWQCSHQNLLSTTAAWFQHRDVSSR